jgi:polyphosphate kinase
MAVEDLVAEEVTTAIVLPPPALDPGMYINRELSTLDYHARVLEEAANPANPLLERLRFLTIVAANLDEFFMIRVSGIREQIKAGVHEKSPDGMTPSDELAAIRPKVRSMLEAVADLFHQEIQPALAEAGIVIIPYAALTDTQRAVLRDYFEQMVFPVCTPLAVDPAHPFPHISNLSLNLAVELQDPEKGRRFARVKVPNVLTRLVPLPGNADPSGRTSPAFYVWMEELLTAHLDMLFPQMELVEIHPFRVLRDAEVEVQEIEADDLMANVEKSLFRRRFGSTVALFVGAGMPLHMRNLLTDNLELDEGAAYVVPGPLGLSDLAEITRLNRADLKDGSFTPRIPAAWQPGSDLFAAIQQGDILLHHPFDSFNPVVDFIRAAATDPNVLAIKQTLYRIGTNSPIIGALLQAAEAGKQVAVLMELKARWDEENNIESARALERAGVHVTYGLPDLKTHCKVALVVRQEGEAIRRYVHVCTGNYNSSTARSYTDIGLLTARPEIGADVSELFNYLTGYSKQTKYRKLLVAPITLRSGILALIEREIARQREHGDGRLLFKLNGLVDPAFVETLYRAAQAGVQVDLIVRGMCCLRPGVPGISDNIRVVSVVGRFLEHSRLYYFGRGGKGELLIGSADLMPRNLDHRVETLVPIEDEAIRSYLVNDVLEAYLRDNAKAWTLQADGSYTRQTPLPGLPAYNVQGSFVERAINDPEVVFSLAALPKKYRKYLTQYGRVDPQE